jgi:hypothetical protein
MAVGAFDHAWVRAVLALRKHKRSDIIEQALTAGQLTPDCGAAAAGGSVGRGVWGDCGQRRVMKAQLQQTNIHMRWRCYE